jgi:hypothetical protein
MKTPAELAEELAPQLMGSCQFLHTLLENYEPELEEDMELNSEFCARLDSLVFCCTDCSWWCEISEMSEDKDWVCQECVDD